MTFEEWWNDYTGLGESLHSREKAVSKIAWEAGIQEGINRMYMIYDFCPECKVAYGKHKMDCSRG